MVRSNRNKRKIQQIRKEPAKETIHSTVYTTDFDEMANGLNN